MTELQKQFEEWAIGTKDQVGLPLFIIKNESGKYVDHATEVSWKAWQASRAAVVVKTGTMKDPSYQATGMVYLDAVEQALDEAGIGYKQS